MECRTKNPEESKVKKIVYIDINTLQEQPNAEEQIFIEWLTAHFDVYIVETDEHVHLLRGSYLISATRHTPAFHGEWICFLTSDKSQIDWKRTSDYFHDVVEQGGNKGYADDDLVLMAMLRSQMRYEDELNLK